MGLKKKLAESEAVGFFLSMLFFFTRWVGRLFEDKADARMRDDLSAKDKKRDRERLETVRNFIVSRPELSPEKYGVPTERYAPCAYLAAVHGVSWLLLNCARHELDEPAAAVFVLKEDGAVCTIDGVERISATATQGQVSRYVKTEYIPLPEETTWNLGKALRQERERVSAAGMTHAQSFLRWMQAALRAKPDLMRGFQTISATETGHSVTLKMVPTDINDDSLAPWKTS